MVEYIDRKAAIGYLEAMAKGTDCDCIKKKLQKAARRVSLLPVADVARVRRGYWTPVYRSETTGWDPELAGNDPIDGYWCSNCNAEAVYDCNDKYVLSKFCPFCGALMDSSGK